MVFIKQVLRAGRSGVGVPFRSVLPYAGAVRLPENGPMILTQLATITCTTRTSKYNSALARTSRELNPGSPLHLVIHPYNNSAIAKGILANPESKSPAKASCLWTTTLGSRCPRVSLSKEQKPQILAGFRASVQKH